MRMMAAFEKGAELRFIGHLDLMRTMQRALRRSHLPIKYSNGFNPHIRLGFAAPLSVGVAGKKEMMEVPIEDGVTPEQFIAGMNAVLPEKLRISFARPVDEDFPTLMSLMAGSRYTITLPVCPSGDAAAAKFDAFMALDEYVADRKTKSGEAPCDIRPFVTEGSLCREGDHYLIRLTTICVRAGALKPSLWLKCLFEFAQAEPVEALICREEMLARNASGALVPMEAYQHG